MKFTKSQIQKQAFYGPFKYDQKVDVSDLVELQNDIIKIDPVRVEGNVSLSHDQFIFTFTISGEMTLPCARTLIDVLYPFEIQACEVFASDVQDDSEEIHPIDGEVLDLTPYIKENILLEIPFRVFSDDPEAASEAPQSGKGWSFVSEEKQEKKIDPRLEKLQSFFKDRTKE